MNLLSHRSGGSSDDFTIYALIGIPLGGFIFFNGFNTWNKYRKVADIATSRVRSMAAGLVELNGKVVSSKNTLTSPVTKAKCVYYKVEHQVYVRGKRSGSWVTTNKKTAFENFFLEDETGKVEVNPQKAEVDIPEDNVKTYGNQRDIEYFLAPGDVVYLLGTAKIKQCVKSAKNQENFLITRGESDQFYYITDKKEKEVQSNLSKAAALQVLGGAIVFLVSLAYLVYRFGL